MCFVSNNTGAVWTTDNNVIVIGVVGVTGSGKSSFIKRVTQCETIIVGEGSESVTEEIAQYEFVYGGVCYRLVDTPGFDDSVRDDEDVFLQLAKWLEKSFRAGQSLNGLLYFHPIISNRERGSEMRNLRMFKKLCGADNFSNVILGLTFCDQEDDVIIADRQKELVETPHWWGDMVAKGSQVRRVPLDPDACIELLSGFAPKPKLTLKIQSELIEGVDVNDTEAAQTILHKQELDSIRLREKQEMAQMHEEYKTRMKKANQDYTKRMELMKQRFESIYRTQKIQEQALRMQRELHEQLERKERLLLAEQKLKEDEEQAELQRLADEIQKIKMENERNERLIQLRKELRALQPLWIKRYLTVESDKKAFFDWWDRGNVKQDYVKYRYSNGQKGGPVTDLMSAFCDRCLKSFAPGEMNYICEDCDKARGTVVKKFMGIDAPDIYICLCKSCKESGKGCFDIDHKEWVEEPMAKIKALLNCERYTTMNPDITCDECRQQVGGAWLHCCTCNDDADICINCWGKGVTCKDKKHDLHVVARCPRPIQQAIKKLSGSV